MLKGSVKKLERRLGLGAVISISMGSMLGSGIFVLPGIAYALTGPSIYIAYLLAAISILPAAVSKSELATAMPTSGGTYVYLERTFGPFAGTVSGLGLYLSLLLKASFALVGFGAYLEIIASFPILYTSLGLLCLIVLLNIFGVGKASSFVAVIVATSVITLLSLGVFGAIEFEPEKMKPLLTNGYFGLLSATALVFVAFAGVTKVAAIAEEIKDPGKNLPRGILLSMFFVTLIYCGLSFVMAGNISGSELTGNLKPIYTLAVSVIGEKIGIAIAVIAILTMTSMANAGILAASRFPFAMARDNLLPGFFGHLSSKFMTPVWSIIVSGIIVAAVILTMDVVKIAKFASAFMIIIYMLENIAVIVLRETRVQWYQPTYKSFAYPFLQLAGIISSLGLLVAIAPVIPAALATVGIPGFLLYVLYSRKRTDRLGVIGIRGTRKDLIEEKNEFKKYVEEFIITEEASVVVAMFGNEKSPEVLTEMGIALADDHKLEVVHVTEIPEQTDLDDIAGDNAEIRAIKRRVNHMADQKGVDIRFDPLVSHDIMKTVNDISTRLHCNWLVIEWGGATRGGFTLHNPVGWLRDHLSCHLMTFRDKGVRYFKKILVVVEMDKNHDTLIDTAEHLAMVHDAEITFATYVEQSWNDVECDKKLKELKEMVELCQHGKDTLLVSGKYDWEAYAKATDEFDMIIIEASPVTKLMEKFFGSSDDKLMKHSVCSVVTIQPTDGLGKSRNFKRRRWALGF